MKIAVISSTVFPSPPSGYAGLEAITWHQAEGLGRLGHEVSLIAPDGSRCEYAKVIPTGPPGQVHEQQAYDKFWKELPSFDCVIDSSWQKWSYVLKMEGKLKAPVLGVCHAPVNTMFNSPPPVDRPCLVAISVDQARSCLSHLRRRAMVAYNGVDVNHYKSNGARRTDRYLFLARFSSIKGPTVAIRACQKAGVGLDLVGDTSITQEPWLLEECQKLADGKQIRIVGPASRGECVNWFSKAKALLHPNQQFQEPFGLAPVEAQLCGCPVIAWDNGAMRETVEEGKTGFLVESEEQMVDLIRADAVSRLDRDYCRQWASRFSIEAMVKRYEELAVLAVNTGGW